MTTEQKIDKILEVVLDLGVRVTKLEEDFEDFKQESNANWGILFELERKVNILIDREVHNYDRIAEHSFILNNHETRILRIEDSSKNS